MKPAHRGTLRAMLGIVVFALCARCTTLPAHAVQPYDPRLPACVNAYGRAMDSLSFTQGQAPIERLYLLGAQCRDSLMFTENLLEDMDDSTFAALERRMPGFSFMRGEGVGLVTDAPYFLALSRSRGGPADTAFFAGLVSTNGEGGFWATYVQPATDYSACTDYGTGKLVEVFGVWDDYRTRYPSHYSQEATKELDDVTETILHDDCACGGSKSVIRELTLFLDRFPRSSLVPDVRQRLARIRSGKEQMRYHCRPT